MKRSILIATSVIVIASAAPATAQQNLCPVPSNSATLNVLTLNILFSEYPHRSQRLADIADFIAANDTQLIALQEVVGGIFDNVVADRLGGEPVDGNTARELRDLLQDRGVQCDLRTAFASGVPALYEVANATLVCGCQFTGNKLVRLLTPASEGLTVAGVTVKLTRSVLMTRLDTEAGSLNIYNTHLCSLCTQQERLRQVREALNFISQVESFAPANHIVFLGDFNSLMGDQVYRRLISNGFADTYAEAKGISVQNGIDPSCTLLNTANTEGCTIGVSQVIDPLLGPAPPVRIDYIFDKGAWTIVDSFVVFNPLATGGQGPSVSDHSGVITFFGPPSP
jgi:endonuclease/exonuclease/phosphatase family metal-dependent hydrolase